VGLTVDRLCSEAEFRIGGNGSEGRGYTGVGVEGLAIGKISTGRMEVVVRSKDEAWSTAYETPAMLQMVADAYTIAMSQLELGRLDDLSEDAAMVAAFDGAGAAYALPPPSDEARAYWHHPGLLSYGNVTVKTVVPSTREASTCAALCASDEECATFAFSALERLCFLFSDAALSFCDPTRSGTCLEKSDELLARLALVSACRYCTFFRADSEALYCGSNSIRCTTLREYSLCLQGKGCGESAKDRQVDEWSHDDLCHDVNCVGSSSSACAMICASVRVRAGRVKNAVSVV